MSEQIEYALLKKLSVLTAARNPAHVRFFEGSLANGYPSAVSSGVDLRDSVWSIVEIALRRDVNKYQNWYKMTISDPAGPGVGEKPSVKVNTTPYTVTTTGGETASALLTTLGTAIVAGEADVDSFTVELDATLPNQIGTLVLKSVSRSTQNTADTNGSLLVTISEEAWRDSTTCAVDYPWALSKGTGLNWFQNSDIPSVGPSSPITENWSLIVRSSGLSRMYLSVSAMDGLVEIDIAPCVVEL